MTRHSRSIVLAWAVLFVWTSPFVFAAEIQTYDVVIVGGTPGGIMTAVAVARGTW